MTANNYYQQAKLAETAEAKRLQGTFKETQPWRHWGSYLSDRQWGTVRESYDASKNPWTDFVHDQARSRAYRWGEDGILGISDIQQLLCFSVALWNEKDPILKERLFGLTNGTLGKGDNPNNCGNHGEDVKEYYYYLDNLPTHAYMKGLYRYPYEYPYADLVKQAGSRDPLEYELIHTGKLDDSRFFDVVVEYAKADEVDILIRITVTNQGAEEKTLHVLPTLWYRNTWAWDKSPPKPGDVAPLSKDAPIMRAEGGGANLCIHAGAVTTVDTSEELLSERFLYCADGPEALFTNNETNFADLWNKTNHATYVKDGINDYVVRGHHNTVNPKREGTKAAAHYCLKLKAGESKVLTLRLRDKRLDQPFGADFQHVFETRQQEATEFYNALCPYKEGGTAKDADLAQIHRQAHAGMLWCKQFYYLVGHRWLAGDAGEKPQAEHTRNRNLTEWEHLYCKDILSMPDAWEYPWFAAWDLAFHATTLAYVDPGFAKHQLELLVMEWYQHPNGQIPAYEWGFSDTNPPVHAWSAWRVYETEKELYGKGDEEFLQRVFGKLNMNFTWWVNKVDPKGRNLYQGGFLGMDNIHVVTDNIDQADGTAWVAMFCLNMVKIATELAKLHPQGNDAYPYKDAARKYLQHFMYLCRAMNNVGGIGLWDDNDKFFMDCGNPGGRLKVFSMVGIVPLFAIENLEIEVNDSDSFYNVDGFLRWFAKNRRDLIGDDAIINMDGLVNAVLAKPPSTAIASNGHRDAPTPLTTLGAQAALNPTLARAATARTQVAAKPPPVAAGAAFFTATPPEGADVQTFRETPASWVPELLQDKETVKGAIAIVQKDKLRQILNRVVDPAQFLSPHGIRSLSLYHLDHHEVVYDGNKLEVRYEPAESITMVRKGGNSNWCGAEWLAPNYMLVDALRKFHEMFANQQEDFRIEYPVGSKDARTLEEVAEDLSWRIIKIFLRDPDNGNRRPVFGGEETFQTDPKWKDYLLFYEYFHGGDAQGNYAGAGLGASHQTGWTGLVANLIQEMGVREWARSKGKPEVGG